MEYYRNTNVLPIKKNDLNRLNLPNNSLQYTHTTRIKTDGICSTQYSKGWPEECEC